MKIVHMLIIKQLQSFNMKKLFHQHWKIDTVNVVIAATIIKTVKMIVVVVEVMLVITEISGKS